MVLQATGCESASLVSSAAETHVNKDGSAERRILLDASPPGPRLTTSDEWSLKSGVDTRGRSVSRSASFENLTADGDHGGMSLKVGDYFLWRTYDFSDKGGGLLSASRAVSRNTGYKLVMPGRIYGTPESVQTASSVAVYNFEDGDDVRVRARSWSIRWWAVAIVLVALAGGGALLLGGRAASGVRGFGRWLWTGRFRAEGRG